jgi:adenosylcobalamin-dependent ribonucleoside-triphosphate reductase
MTDERVRKEDWWETILRATQGVISRGPFTKDDAELLYHYTFMLKCMFSGRSLWQLGTKYVDKWGQDSLQSCWQVAINDPVATFAFVFDELMMGGGVGFNISPPYVYEMPIVKFNPTIERKSGHDVDLIVADNREGWVRLLKRVLKCFFKTGRNLTYSADCIRDKGAPINGFGGTASGPEILCKGIDKIVKILSSRHENKLRPIHCLDILNIIGSIVVAGNVRRSAQIALGSKNDEEFLQAKNWVVNPELPAHRSMSNNSILADSYESAGPLIWEGYGGDGEAYGWVNLKNCRRFGRIADGLNYRPDPGVVGVNPCGEITLEPYESCNLTDIFLPNCSDEEFHKAARINYMVSKTISTIPAIYAQTNEVLERNRRLGLGITGFLQDPVRAKNHQLFDSVYKMVEAEDEDYSRLLGVRKSIKLTTVKPSGTVSLLPGVTPGVHPTFSPYHIRRIRMGSLDPLVKVCRDSGYHVEPEVLLDGTRNLNTMVIDFPVAAPKGAICAKDLSAVDQLEHAKFLQTHWSDNSVSVSVYYRKDELLEIKAWMKENYQNSMKCVSFMLHKDHGFKQAPYEEITEAQYKELKAGCKPITRIENDGQFDIESGGCATNACPVK